MEIWKEIIITLVTSIFGGGGAAWVYLKLAIKDTAGTIVDNKLKDFNNTIDKKLENYTTREDMQIERKELLEEVERKFLTLAAFREFEKRMEKNFETIDRRLSDSSKRFDKLDKTLEHITDLLIQQR